MKISYFLIAAALLACGFAAPLSAAEIPPDYTATYEVTRGGIRGETTDRLTKGDGPGEYVMQSMQRVRGAASLLISRQPSQTSRFQVTDTGIVVREFAFDDGTRKGTDNISVQFDWESGRAAYTAEGITEELDLEPGTLDLVVVSLAAMMDLADGKESLNYPVLEKGSIRAWQFHRVGEEEVSTPAGDYTAIKFRLDSGRNYETLYWFAPELSYLPVHIQQQREKRSAVISLISVEGL